MTEHPDNVTPIGLPTYEVGELTYEITHAAMHAHTGFDPDAYTDKAAFDAAHDAAMDAAHDLRLTKTQLAVLCAQALDDLDDDDEEQTVTRQPPHERFQSVLPEPEDFETIGRLALARLDEDWQRAAAIISEIFDGRDKTAVMRLVIAATSVLLGALAPTGHTLALSDDPDPDDGEATAILDGARATLTRLILEHS
jgi:hypothetical protein